MPTGTGYGSRTRRGGGGGVDLDGPPSGGGTGGMGTGGYDASSGLYTNTPDGRKYKDITAASQGMSLGAALLNLDTQEANPTAGGGGAQLLARLDRRIGKVERKVGGIEQVLVV